MARGIPVVTTPVGAEGIATTEDQALVIAPCDGGFATSALAAVKDLETGRRQAKRARKLVEESFSSASITARLTAIYEGE